MSIALLLAAALQTQTPGGFTPISVEDCLAEAAAEGVVEAHEEASCFVNWLYGPGVLDTVTPLGADLDQVFSTETASAVRALRARMGDEGSHPALDADPVCACQDPAGLILVASVVRDAGPTTATAVVRFTYYPIYDQPIEGMSPDDVFENTLILVKQGDGWRIHDILVPENGYSFLASLAE